jgi:hypothetical protein
MRGADQRRRCADANETLTTQRVDQQNLVFEPDVYEIIHGRHLGVDKRINSKLIHARRMQAKRRLIGSRRHAECISV